MIENMDLIILKYGFDEGVKSVLLEAAEQNINLAEYAINGYDEWQLRCLKSAIQKKLDLTHLLNKSLNFYQMQELIRALAKGVDISDYADPNISYIEMMGHTVSKLRDVNVKHYFMQDYTDDQLYEILAGIENGIDVSQYEGVEVDADTMNAVKSSLMKEAGINEDTELININCF